MVEDRLARPRLFVAATALELLRLERNARRSPEAVRADQLRRLRSALRGAGRAPFWARHLGPVADIEAIDQLQELPTSDKPLLREAPERDLVICPPPPGTRTFETSGTTGVPLVVHYGGRAAWWQGVLRLRSGLHRGIRPWDRVGTMALAQDPRRTPGLTGVSRRSRQVWLAPSSDHEELARQVIEHRPVAISGHPHLLIELGEALRGRYELRSLLTHGETLTPEIRSELRGLFGVEALDSYGTAECGSIAWQCREADLYHVNHEAVVLELLDDDGRWVPPGEIGSITFTSLWNPLMPMVRYRIGDAAMWADRPCRCGSKLPALTRLAGRTFSWIVDADGRRVAPQMMWASLHLGEDYLRSLKRYRVRQDATRRVHVEVVPTDAFTEHHRQRWIESYRKLLGDLPIEIETVDHVTITPGEKFEIISSEAAAPPR